MKPSVQQAAIAEFLRDHPERKDGCREHPRLGTMMDTATTIAFGEWSVRKGYSTPEHLDTLKAAMKHALENKAAEGDA